MAIDSESVAYIPPKVGTNEKAAAIVQVATKDYVVIFVVHEWLALYDSFKAFLESDVEKVALNINVVGKSKTSNNINKYGSIFEAMFFSSQKVFYIIHE